MKTSCKGKELSRKWDVSQICKKFSPSFYRNEGHFVATPAKINEEFSFNLEIWGANIA